MFFYSFDLRTNPSFPHSIHTLNLALDAIVEITLDRVVVDRVGDEFDQEEYLAVSMVRPRSSMETALGQRRAVQRRCKGDAVAVRRRRLAGDGAVDFPPLQHILQIG